MGRGRSWWAARSRRNRESAVTRGCSSSTCSASGGWAGTFSSSTDLISKPPPTSSTRPPSCDFGLGESFAILDRGTERTVRVPRAGSWKPAARSSAMLLNVMGVDDEELLAAAPRRVFLDIDPGFPQMWRELGLHDAFRGYDDFVTIGESIGHEGCGAPLRDRMGDDAPTGRSRTVADLRRRGAIHEHRHLAGRLSARSTSTARPMVSGFTGSESSRRCPGSRARASSSPCG